MRPTIINSAISVVLVKVIPCLRMCVQTILMEMDWTREDELTVDMESVGGSSSNPHAKHTHLANMSSFLPPKSQPLAVSESTNDMESNEIDFYTYSQVIALSGCIHSSSAAGYCHLFM